MRRFLALTVIALALVAACRDLPTEIDPAARPVASTLAFSAQAIGCDADALIDALNAANISGESTINLAGGCTYTLTAVNNYSAEFGINGLPIITSTITINGNGATIERGSTAADFRIFYVLNAGDPEQGLGNLTLNDLTISGGKASNAGGGLFNNGGTVTINHGTVSGNESGDAGGGLANAAGGTLTVGHSTITGNKAGDAGGGLSNNEGTVSVNNSTISGNETSDFGGGVSSIGGTLTLNHSTISGNHAGDAGGGLSNNGGTVNIINSSAISENQTGDHGGGLKNFGGTGTVTIDNSSITGNFAFDGGGGVSNEGGTVNIINHSSISGNGVGDDGGGVSNTAAGILTVQNSTISDNEAKETGGGLYNYDGTATVTSSTASSNRAKWGGGLFNETGELGDPEGGATLTVHNSTISGNHAEESGGGLYNYKGGHLTVTSSTISGNEAVIKSGGGVLSYNDINGRVEVKGSIIAGNTPEDVAAVEDKTRFNSQGYNLIGTAGAFVNLNADFSAPGDQRNVTNPGLGPLQDNGGPTFTRALLSTSPAVNAIPITACTDEAGSAVSLDQRGVGRLAGSACDIGAFEGSSSQVPQTITFNQPASPQTYGVTFTVNPTASSGLPVSLTASGDCSASGYDVTMARGTGACVLTASQGGDASNSAAADVQYTVDAQKAERTVTARDESIREGDSPDFDVRYSGFVPPDDVSSLGGSLVLTFEGTDPTGYGPSTTEPVAPGTYSITPSGWTSNDYSFDYVAGAFTITPAQAYGNAYNGSATSLTINKLAGVRAGDFLLAQITFEKGSAAGSNPQITPSGWTLVRRTNRGSDLGQAIFYRVATAAEPPSYTWTFSQSLIVAGGILRYTGINPAAPIVSSSGNSGDSNTLTAPGVNAATNSILVAFFGLKKKATSLSTPASMTARYYFESPKDVAILGAEEPRATAGATGNRTSTAGHADKWVAQHVVLRAN